jgi:hypothetical protein
LRVVADALVTSSRAAAKPSSVAVSTPRMLVWDQATTAGTNWSMTLRDQ